MAEKTDDTKTMAVSKPLFDEAAMQAFQAVLPKVLPLDRFARVCGNCLKRIPKLRECDPKTLMTAFLNCAEIGLEPDGVWGSAYLIPYGREAKLVIGYKGLLQLARRSGEISEVYADVVRKGDLFRVTRGSHPGIDHEPHLDPDGKGDTRPVTHVYACATLRDGGRQSEVMSFDEVEAVRKRSKAANNGPWVTDWCEMAKKTVFRRLAKWLPVSVEMRQALEFDHDTIDVEPNQERKAQAIEALRGTFLASEPETIDAPEGTAADLTAILVDLPDDVADGIMAEIDCKTIAAITPDQIARGLELANRAAAKLVG